MKPSRIKGLRIKKDGTVTKQVSFDIPKEMEEKLSEISKKTGISKKFLLLKALKLLCLEQV